jgi:hypothetical protein
MVVAKDEERTNSGPKMDDSWVSTVASERSEE